MKKLHYWVFMASFIPAVAMADVPSNVDSTVGTALQMAQGAGLLPPTPVQPAPPPVGPGMYGPAAQGPQYYGGDEHHGWQREDHGWREHEDHGWRGHEDHGWRGHEDQDGDGYSRNFPEVQSRMEARLEHRLNCVETAQNFQQLRYCRR